MTSERAKPAMLVNLSISQWYNKATDSKVVHELAQKYGEESTTDDSYVKSLLPKESMAAIQKAIGRMRTAHYKMTLPWEDGGLRILPSKMYFEYIARMNKLKEDFDAAVADFVKRYYNYKEAARVKKGPLFNAADYPPENTISSYFEVRTSFLPLPDSGDFRLDLDETTLEEIRSGATAAVSANLHSSTQYLYSRFQTLLEAYCSATFEGKKRFHESTVANLYEFVEAIPLLNVTNDDNLEHFAHKVSNNLCQFSADALKRDEESKKFAHKFATELLNELKAAKEGKSGV